MAACGAAFEITRWTEGTGLKIKLVDKAAMDRSGAVAQGLSAINTYMGENDPADYVRYVRNDLMGIIREDLIYDVGRHVDDSVHNFEEWGLPIWKQPGDEDKTLRAGRQAGALGQVADHDQRRILQVDRRRGREKSARHGQHPGARVHRAHGHRQERPDAASPARRVSRCASTSSTSTSSSAACWPAAARSTCSVRARSAKARAAPGTRCGTPARPTRWRPNAAPK